MGGTLEARAPSEGRASTGGTGKMAKQLENIEFERSANHDPTYSVQKKEDFTVVSLWDPVDIGWIAGLIEGEGSILYMKHNTIVNVSMTDEDVIRSIVDRLQIGSVVGPYRRDIPNRKPIWRWHIGDRRSVARLLLAIYPLLGNRRRIAVEKIVDEIHELNKYLEPRSCKECGESFQPNSFYSARRQVFCGIPCNQKWHRRERTRRERGQQCPVQD